MNNQILEKSLGDVMWMLSVEENVWARAFAVIAAVALIVPLFVFNHVQSLDDNESPLFSEPNESKGDQDFPFVFVEKQVQPTTIYPRTAPPGAEPKSANITLTITGSGQPRNVTKPQDTIFIIDNSGSMCNEPPYSDCEEIRIDAVEQYIDAMSEEDRAAIVAFGKDCFEPGFVIPWGAWIVDWWGCKLNREVYHLTPMDKAGKQKLKKGAETLRWSEGGSNIEKAISFANWELIPGYQMRPTCFDWVGGQLPPPPPGGDPDHTWVQILLTDGKPSHLPKCVNEEVQDAVNAEIRIFTIGLGIEADEAVLRDYISTPTGGKYYFASKPEDLPAIYAEIGTEVADKAFRPLPGIEPEVIDAIPKNLNPSDFVPTPTEIVDGGSHWLVKWDLSETLRIGDTWEASYAVSSELPGIWNVTTYGVAKVQYTAWDGNRTETLIPSAFLNVMSPPPPSPPYNVSAILSGSGFEHMTLAWNLSEDDGKNWGSVGEYRIFRGDVFDPQGQGYAFYDSVPNGTGEYVDYYAGEGDPSNHFYYICAFSLEGLSGCDMNQVGKFTRPLLEGLNLISIPLVQSDESPGVVLQTVEFDMTWTYYSADAIDPWKWYMTFKSYRRGLWNMNHTMGYWVNVTEDGNLTVAGMVPTRTTIHLFSGWNLISFPSFNTSYTTHNLKMDSGADHVEGYDPTPPYNLRVLGDVETLRAGHAYWVRVVTDVDLVVEIA